MTLVAFIVLVIKTSIVLSVLALGMRGTFSNVTYLLHRPAHLGRALVAMYVLMPIFAVAMVFTLNLPPAVKIAIVALSVSPMPPILPKKALKAGGSKPYTLSLLIITAVLTIVSIPLTMEILPRFFGVAMRMTPLAIAGVVLQSIILPLLVGLIFRVVAPSTAERLANPIALIATVLLVLGVLPVLFSSRRDLVSLVGDGTLVGLAAFALLGIVVGHFFGGPEQEHRTVLALATSARHPGIAFAIAHTNFPNQKLSLAAILIYLILATVIAIPYLSWSKREMAARETAETEVG